ncbi:MAG: cation:proton antiporter [Burkholderiaceae bacterium]|jgi:CPA2 family monovalent cation:H+ antiporter-2|nr:cation:proton antiporter [Burkholderiaceae bacterium]
MSSLALTLLYLITAVCGVVTCRWLKLPPMLGYLVAGVLIGPHAFALAQDSQDVRHLSEFGVVFLMFMIGLDFSQPRLRAMRKHVFGLGLAQVVLTMVLASAFMVFLSRWLPEPWGIPWPTALTLAGAMAMSSTAIVAKLMADRLEFESEHGRRVMGVLLFQDLAVVPLLVLIPALGAPSRALFETLAWALIKAIALIAVLLFAGPRLMRPWLALVARQRSPELFMLNLLLMTLGLSWLTQRAGLSLALGAFIAGILVADTEYKLQVDSDIRPFHDLLLGLFFITVGMSLDWHIVVHQWALVIALLILPLAFKLALVTALARVLGASAGVALRTGLYLAQAGEFGFVLLAMAQQHALVPAWLADPVLAAMVLSMLSTPFMIQYSNTIVRRLIVSDWLQQSLHMTRIARQTMNTAEHVIICGYGRCGQGLAHMLEHENVPYVAMDLDPDRVRQASDAGDPVVFGDAARPPLLMAAGLARARAVAITYLDVPSTLKVLANVRAHAPRVPVIVRTQDDRDLERLQAAGAAEVVPEAIEGSLMLASHALALTGVPMRRILRSVQNQRNARYALLRGYFHGADDGGSDEVEQERLETFTVEHGAAAIGRPLGAFELDALDVRTVSLRRRGPRIDPAAGTVLAENDTLVLSGRAGALAEALARLHKGGL